MNTLTRMITPPGSTAGRDQAQNQYDTLEAQQQAHDQAVTQGKGEIDDAFGQFDDNYYNGVGSAYTGAYDPQLKDQYNKAQQSMFSTLAGGDQLDGSTGAYDLAQLDKQRDTAQADIGNGAVDAENNMRSNVNNAKTNLYGVNAATADPLQMASEATGTASSLVSPQSYPTLGNIFGDVLGPVAGGVKAYQTSTQGGGSSYGPGFTVAPSSGNVVQ